MEESKRVLSVQHPSAFVYLKTLSGVLERLTERMNHGKEKLKRL